MTDENVTYTYIFLDDEKDRRILLALMREVRQEVTNAVEALTEKDLYEPRYHGWSMAAMLAHLNLMDNIAMLQIKLSLIGAPNKITLGMVNSLNNFTARIFHNRLIKASLNSMSKNEERIGEFILRLPVAKLSRQVYSPTEGKYTTIERYIQDRFLLHWREHLTTIRQAEGLQPPEPTDTN
jgi:hypothetical protein